MKDTANTPTRSGKSVDGDSAVKSTGKQKKLANATEKKQNTNTAKQNNKKDKKVKEKKQAMIPDHPKTNYSRKYQFRYDARIKLDEVLDDASAKLAISLKFKSIFKKLMEEESSAVLYPYSSSSSLLPITLAAKLPNTYTDLKRHVPSLNPPAKNSDLAYCQIYIGTNTCFDDWKSNILEWMKEEGHGLFIKYIQDERTTPCGYLLYTHRMSNAPWYQTTFSEKANVPIAARFRKISGQKSKDRAAIHLECGRDNHAIVKDFLRIHCSKNTKPPYITGFPVIFIPDKMHISNKHSKSGAQIVAKRQGSLINKIELRTSWSIYGIDMVNKKHKISLRTMISKIMWEDDDKKNRQLFHSVDSTWNDEGTIFGWHPQFDDQAQTVMTGLLPYLKSQYGDTVESYFSPGAVTMQSKQRWDEDKGGVIGEDDTFITSTSAEDSWWDEENDDAEEDNSKRKIAVDTSKKPKIDAKRVVNAEEPDVEDDNTLPSLHTKAGEDEIVDDTTMNEILASPPPMKRNIVNDDSTITSNLTMDTRMADVENNIGDMNNEMSQMNFMLRSFIKEIRQGNNQSLANMQNNNDSTKVVEGNILNGPQK